MNSLLTSVSAQDLRRAAEIKEKIESLQAELAQILGSESVAPRRRSSALLTKGQARVKKSRVKRSAAVRARLSAIAKARWKKARAAGKTAL